MRRAHRSFLPGLIVLLVLFGLVAPQAAAQDPPPEESCPEGLVYDEAGDICLLPEDVPVEEESAEEEPVDIEDAPDDPVDDSTDDGSDSALDEDVIDDGNMTDDADEGATDGDMDDPAADAPAIAADAGETIKNLTLLTFACPINWDPATREIDASREMCTEPIVPAMNYTIVYDGQEMVTTGLGTDVDLAEDLGLNGVPLPSGMWTIRENLQEGLDDPFAFCAIYAADGASRLTVAETVPGGSLDILLAAGEEVNCEWYSVATVPETTGDPNALPIGGLKLDGFSCPYGTDSSSTRERLTATCTAKGLAAVEYTASLGGAVVSTQTGATDTPGVDFQTGLDTRLLSGTWTIAANLPPEYEASSMYCTVTTEAGTTTALEPETLFDSVELALQPGDTGSCQWFNVEAEPRSGPSLGITLLLHTCPEGFDPDGGDYQTCTLPLQEPIAFDFIREGQVVETGTAAPPATELKFSANDGKPEAGEWTIRPSISPDRIEPGWACWGVDDTGAKVLGIDYFSPTDGGSGISAKFGPNLMLQCDVWIYAGDLSEFVTVTAHTCPDGFDVANPAAGDRNATCTKARRIGFTYTVDDVPAGEGEMGSNGLAITPRQPGQWRITAAPGEGSGVTFVTCDQVRAALNQVQTIEPTINADQRSITLDLDEGDSLRCDFFLGPSVASSNADTAAMETGTDDEAGEEPGMASDEAAPAEDASTDAGQTGEGTDPMSTTPGDDTFGGGSDAPEGENGTGEEPAGPGTDRTAAETADDSTAPDTTGGDGTAGEPDGGGTSSFSIQHYACDRTSNAGSTTSREGLKNRTRAEAMPRAWSPTRPRRRAPRSPSRPTPARRALPLPTSSSRCAPCPPAGSRSRS